MSSLKSITANLLFILFLILTNLSNAQKSPRDEHSFYEQISTAFTVKNAESFNLKKNVRSMVELRYNSNDTLSLDFNSDGNLIKRHISSSKNQENYLFKNNHLMQITIHKPGNNSLVNKYFTPSGYLKKEMYSYLTIPDSVLQEMIYSYNDKFDTLEILYKYNLNVMNRDVILCDYYYFSFNDKSQIIRERRLSKHPQGIHGSTASYVYDTISEKLISYAFKEDCAGSNSCLDIEVTLAYDKHGNITHKYLFDHTVRNALWSYDYSYNAKYNSNNDIIEKTIPIVGDILRTPLLFTGVSTKDKLDQNIHLFEYEYDEKGNWIKKWQVINDDRTLVRNRIITYYD